MVAECWHEGGVAEMRTVGGGNNTNTKRRGGYKVGFTCSNRESQCSANVFQTTSATEQLTPFGKHDCEAHCFSRANSSCTMMRMMLGHYYVCVHVLSAFDQRMLHEGWDVPRKFHL